MSERHRSTSRFGDLIDFAKCLKRPPVECGPSRFDRLPPLFVRSRRPGDIKCPRSSSHLHGTFILHLFSPPASTEYHCHRWQRIHAFTRSPRPGGRKYRIEPSGCIVPEYDKWRRPAPARQNAARSYEAREQQIGGRLLLAHQSRAWRSAARLRPASVLACAVACYRPRPRPRLRDFGRFGSSGFG